MENNKGNVSETSRENMDIVTNVVEDINRTQSRWIM